MKNLHYQWICLQFNFTGCIRIRISNTDPDLGGDFKRIQPDLKHWYRCRASSRDPDKYPDPSPVHALGTYCRKKIKHVQCLKNNKYRHKVGNSYGVPALVLVKIYLNRLNTRLIFPTQVSVICTKLRYTYIFLNLRAKYSKVRQQRRVPVRRR